MSKIYFTKLIGEWNGVVFTNQKHFFLSRDIQAGDEVLVLQFNGKPNWKATFIASENGNHRLQFLDKSGFFGCAPDGYLKVIGEVSPDAIWVTEGMEFDLTDFNPLSAASIEHNKTLTGYIKIKCSQCKQFH